MWRTKLQHTLSLVAVLGIGGCAPTLGPSGLSASGRPETTASAPAATPTPYPAGTILTVAGSDADGWSGDGDWATLASLSDPEALAVDHDGGLLFTVSSRAEDGARGVRRADPAGTLSTVIGPDRQSRWGVQRRVSLDTSELQVYRPTPPLESDPVNTMVSSPSGVAVDPEGGILFADAYMSGIRLLRPGSRLVTWVAGVIATDPARAARLPADFLGDDGPARQAFLCSPHGMAVDSAGTIYVADSGNNRIRRIDRQGTITTIAGSGPIGRRLDGVALPVPGDFGGDGGLATAARLSDPRGVAVGPDGSLIIADSGNHRIRRIDRQGIITTIAGKGGLAPITCGPWAIVPSGGIGWLAGDGGPAIDARLNSPTGVTVDRSGNIYIADSGNHRVRKVAATGLITTIAGTGGLPSPMPSQCGSPGSATGDGGPAWRAGLYYPTDVVIGRRGEIYIADSVNSRIRMVLVPESTLVVFPSPRPSPKPGAPDARPVGTPSSLP